MDVGSTSVRVRAAVLAIAASLGAGCSAGGDGTNQPVLGGTTAGCRPARLDPAQLLRDPGLESANGSWGVTSWGGAAVTSTDLSRGQHAGNGAQEVRVHALPDGGGVLLAQEVVLRGGQSHQASVWLRSPDSATISFLLRRKEAYFEAAAVRTVTLTNDWRKYTVRGGFDGDVRTLVGVAFRSRGTVDVDDAALQRLSESSCPASTRPIPASYFGVHVNKWGTYNTWPAGLGAGLVRLWDTGTTWADLEPARGGWNWSRLDLYVNAAARQHQSLLYTFGQTPLWAGPRRTAAPRSLADWRSYIRATALRYRGRIHYWEIWNEANIGTFYSGTPAEMVQLALAARQELKAVDPGNVVLSPNFTATGLEWFSEFLYRGGGAAMDAVSVHRYTQYMPERDAPFYLGVRDVMATSGLGGKPLWNTEGATYGRPPNAQAAVGAMARDYLLQWCWGISSFAWYGWDIDLGNPLSLPDYVRPTATGAAYTELARWLRGASVRSLIRDAGGTHTLTMRTATGQDARVLWNDAKVVRLVPPASWQIREQRNLRGTRFVLGPGARVEVGPAPVLLR